MADEPLSPKPTAKGRRRWWRWAAAVALVLALAVASLPWLLGTGPARRWLLGRANAALAPARLEVGRFAFSWFGPTRMTGFRIYDHDGDRVVDAASATWDRNLWQALFDRPRYGTLTLGGVALDVERRPDGTVDLYEALRPILTGRPETAFRVVTAGGRLTLRSDGLEGPLSGDLRSLVIDRPPAPGAVTWTLRLSQPGAGGEAMRSLETRGRYDRWLLTGGTEAPLAFDLTGRDWPLSLEAGGVGLRGRLDGRLDFARAEGVWRVSGRTALAGGELAGPALRGDRVALGSLTAEWGASRSGSGWRVESLDVATDLGTLKASGPLPSRTGESSRVEGRLDLAELARRAPRALGLRAGLVVERGSAELTVVSSGARGGIAWDVSARVGDLVAELDGRRVVVSQPATLGARLVDGGRRGLSVAWLELDSAFLKARGSGDVDRGVDVEGTVDLAALEAQFRDVVDFGGLDLSGRGTLRGGYRRRGDGYAGQLDLTLADLALGGGRGAREARVRLGVSGPADNSGAPTGWSRASASLRSGDLAADVLALAESNELAAIGAGVDRGVTLRGESGSAEARLFARREGDGWAIDEASLEVAADHGSPGSRAGVLLSGSYEPSSGTLRLRPVASGPVEPGPLRVAPEGIELAGLGGPDWRARGKLEGAVEEVARFLSAWSGEMAISDLRGGWSARAEAWGTPEGSVFAGKLELPDLSWPAADGSRRGPGPLALDAAGGYRGASDELTFTELVASSRFATLEAAGRLSEPGGARVADLRGRLTPDFEAISDWLGERVEPGARVAGGPREFRLTGRLDPAGGDVLAGIEAELGFDLSELDVFGMRLGATPVVARVRDGSVTLDPIRTTLNGGSLRVDPEVERGGDGSWTVRLGSGSSLSDAEVNDEVSRRVLSYVAPVLDRATRVRGRVSAEVARAEFPIGPGFRRETVVEGRVVFQDVAFAPGPLATSLVALVGAEAATLRLDEPVVLSIAEGRVRQRGLAVPLGNLSRIELAGDVGFDRSLDLVASLPITRSMVANNDLLGDVVEGTRIAVPIRGTLSNPQIDREAFRTAMNDLGKTLLRRGAARGAAELIFRLSQPRPRRERPRRGGDRR